MAVPEIIEWENSNGFRISGVRDEIFDDIYIEVVLNSLYDSLSPFDQLVGFRKAFKPYIN